MAQRVAREVAVFVRRELLAENKPDAFADIVLCLRGAVETARLIKARHSIRERRHVADRCDLAGLIEGKQAAIVALLVALWADQREIGAEERDLRADGR